MGQNPWNALANIQIVCSYGMLCSTPTNMAKYILIHPNFNIPTESLET